MPSEAKRRNRTPRTCATTTRSPSRSRKPPRFGGIDVLEYSPRRERHHRDDAERVFTG